MDVPHDVFSTMRIDEGTILLLENLPAAEPKRVLDMGCGYGALGLPIAARFPQAHFDLVDRDLLAAEWSQNNAQKNNLSNVKAFGSLGFRDVPSHVYDWILCNVPARIGTPFIQNLFEEGNQRLALDGELRVVVIRDLAPVLEELAKKLSWPLVENARGPRHVIFSLPRRDTKVPVAEASGDLDLYFRDTVSVAGKTLDRPYDLGGDDPKRLAHGLPVLFDTLPRQSVPKSVLSFRCGYGVVPIVCKSRWPGAEIVAMDRDLLATTFTRRNFDRLEMNDVVVKDSVGFSAIENDHQKFDLVVGELSPSAGERVAVQELQTIQRLLGKGGQGLVLVFDKFADQIKSQFPMMVLLRREGFSVLLIRPL